MDITSVSGASAFQQSQIASNVQSSVAVKVLDAAKEQGAGVLELLQASNLQSTAATGSIDIKA